MVQTSCAREPVSLTTARPEAVHGVSERVRERTNPLSGFVCTKRSIKVLLPHPRDHFAQPFTKTSRSTTLNNARECVKLCYSTVTSLTKAVYLLQIVNSKFYCNTSKLSSLLNPCTDPLKCIYSSGNKCSHCS
jgi:hypothetical protein